MAQQLSFEGFGNDRLPPQNIEAEESILGGILLDPEGISRVADRLLPEAFYVSTHKEIYQAALKLHSQGKPTDLLSLTAWLSDHNLLTRIGGKSKLAQLVDRTVSAVNIDALAALVMEKYLRRKLIQSGNEIVQLGYKTETELATVLDEAEQKVFSITQERPQQGLVSLSDTLIFTFQDIESRHQGVALPGLPCGFYDLDAMTGGFQRSDLVIVAGRPSMGKCLSYSAEIVLSDGRIATIEELYQNRHADLLTLNDDWKLTFTQPVAFVDDGVKPVLSVTTSLGRCVETTITHPYLTIKGWQPLSDLTLGNKIAVPRKINVFGTETIQECEVKLLAYLIGDSALTSSSLQFINTNPLLQEEFAQAVITFADLKVSFEDDISRSSKNSLILWLEKLGVWGKDAHAKTIPPIVFKLNKALIALFLNRLFATDGWATVLASNQAQLGYATVSERLARQIQHLLLRFGIIAALNKQAVKYKDIHRTAWQLNITDAQSIKTFISEIGIFSKENALALALEELPRQELATNDVYWDEIVSIESIGYKQVYDLTIPVTHNFVANDICVHNTSFALNLAHNIAAFHKLPVAIFSLEMSKEQLVQRLLASEAGIESNRLRAGRVSQNEWEPLSRAIGILSEMPIFIDDTPNITVTEMRSHARRLQAEQGGEMGLILLDYLQLMEGSGDNRVQELSKITRSLKGLARELNVPIIALSQLSRGVETRNNKRPMMSDLRESGSIEQDADLVIMLYRDSYYNPDSPDRNIAEVIVTKHRNGPTGTVKLLFEPNLTKFMNLAKNQNY